MSQIIPLKATLFWANLSEPNQMSSKYQVDLCLLSDAAQQALSSIGVEVKNAGDERGHYITCKSNNHIRAFFDSGEEVTGVMVGNGSKAIASVGSYDWTFKNKQGTSPSLKRLTITDLKVYEGSDEVVEIDEAAAL